MSANDLRNILGDKLRLLAAEMFAREGYHIADNPEGMDVDILVTNPSNKGTKAFFVSIAGRESVSSLTESDIENAVVRSIEIPDSSLLLIITTKQSATAPAREMFANLGSNKDIWYLDEVRGYLEQNHSTYLVDIYNNDMFKYSGVDELKSRFAYQGISVSEQVIEYICDKSYHPRRLIAYIELSHRDKTIDIFNTRAVKEFRKETGADDFV